MPSIIARPTSGRSAIATATARLSWTTGDGSIRARAAYSAAIWAQSVSAAVAASSWSAAMAAWSWYGTGPAGRQRALDERPALGDPAGVPARPVLVVEQDELPVRPDPRLPASVVEEHQRQQAHDLGLVGEQRPHDPRQADRLARELAAHERVARGRGVALVEDQVEDLEDAVEPLRQELEVRDPVRDAGVADLPLRPDEALGERRLRDEEGPGDLGRRQAAERPQGQRDAAVQRQRRMAAGEDQPEPVVGDGHRRPQRDRARSRRAPPRSRRRARASWSSRAAACAGGAGRWPGSGPWS